MKEAVARETQRSEQLLSQQHERLSAALEEEREKQEEKMKQVLQEAQEKHKVGRKRGGESWRGRGREEDPPLEGGGGEWRVTNVFVYFQDMMQGALQECQEACLAKQEAALTAQREESLQEVQAALKQERDRSEALVAEMKVSSTC